jgi:hypothetical protein
VNPSNISGVYCFKAKFSEQTAKEKICTCFSLELLMMLTILHRSCGK